MVSFIARFRFPSEDRAEVLEAVRQLVADSRKEPGCLTYIPAHPEADPDTLLILEQYADEKALAAHRDSEHYKKYCVAVLFQKMKDREIENLVALG
ncbi:putative quinol monooxygenase [Telmatobacter bradus]|uniref:putative quinol monooxygenase n=1 Tax=Telmatobacter bradus TaxID=474953 RepID=UPI003B433160